MVTRAPVVDAPPGWALVPLGQPCQAADLQARPVRLARNPSKSNPRRKNDLLSSSQSAGALPMKMPEMYLQSLMNHVVSNCSSAEALGDQAEIQHSCTNGVRNIVATPILKKSTLVAPQGPHLSRVATAGRSGSSSKHVRSVSRTAPARMQGHSPMVVSADLTEYAPYATNAGVHPSCRSVAREDMPSPPLSSPSVELLSMPIEDEDEPLKVLTAAYDGSSRLFNASNGDCERTFQASRSVVNSACFSPDARSVLAAPFKNHAKVFDLDSGKCQQTFRGHRAGVNTAKFSTDGAKVLTSSRDHTAKIFSAATGECECTLSGHSNSVTSSSFSDDGLYVVSASADGTARLFDAETGENTLTFAGHTAWVSSAVFSPDSRQVATSSKDGTAKLFDVASGACEQTFTVENGDILTSAVFSPDAQLLLTTSRDAFARLYDLRHGECVRTFHGHRVIINSANFSPDGRQILTASGDCTARIHDVGTGRCAHSLQGHRAALTMAIFVAGVKLS